jgi:spermidine synthase
LRLLRGLRGRRRNGADASVEISEQDGIRYLHLGSATIQSGMRVNDPDDLVLAYTRSMMAFLLFAPEPQRVVSVGLGGGSVNKWIYRHFPQAEQVAIELNPRVIAVARQYFQVPADNARLKVIQADGARWVAEHWDSADVVLVDGYDGQSHAAELATPEFYSAVARALRRDGILAVNLWGSDPQFDEYVRRIEAAFEGQVACVPALQKGNIIVLAFKRRPLSLRWDELRERAKLLEARYGLEFVRFVEGLKRLNPHTDKRLLI